jgi:hypothetical protein
MLTPREFAGDGIQVMPMTAPAPSPLALRLLFSYDGDSVRLVSGRTVEMTVPPSDPVDGYQGQAGFWAELRDASGTTLFRRVLHDPTPVYREVHSPRAPATRTPARNQTGVFEVVLPSPPPGSRVVLFRTPQPPLAEISDFAAERTREAVPRVGTGAAEEIAGFDLDEATQR